MRTFAGTVLTDPEYVPKNAVSGVLGVSSTQTAQIYIAGMTGTYQVCSKGILGKFAKQLDIQMDDGKTDAGSMRVVEAGGNTPSSTAVAAPDDATNYAVCMVF